MGHSKIGTFDLTVETLDAFRKVNFNASSDFESDFLFQHAKLCSDISFFIISDLNLTQNYKGLINKCVVTILLYYFYLPVPKFRF